MKEITRLIINEYKMKEIDFMGYKFNKENASFHHLIIPRRNNGLESIENGAVLNSKTSHPYLHIVEGRDYELFLAITSEIIDEKVKGYIDEYNLRRIADMLRYFEREHSSDTTSKGKVLIKEEFIKGRVF